MRWENHYIVVPEVLVPIIDFPKGVLCPPTQKFYICQSSPHTSEGSQTCSLHSLFTLLARPSFSYAHGWRVDGGRERRGRKLSAWIFWFRFRDFSLWPTPLLFFLIAKLRALATTVIIFYSCIHTCSLSSLIFLIIILWILSVHFVTFNTPKYLMISET